MDKVTVVFAANDYYAPYLSALFASILDHRTVGRPYEFLVLSEDFSERNKGVLAEQVDQDGAGDVSLRFVDVTAAMAPYQEQLHTHSHFKMETYFRLLMPQILPDLHKVLYLDADMICLRDVAEAFDTDVDGCLVAACKDADTAGIYNGLDIDIGHPDVQNYMDNVLKIRNPYEYFQAGTIVFNLDEWRERIDVDEVFRFAQERPWQLLDQDVLNYFCQGHVRFLDMAWNVMFDLGGFRIREIISHSTDELRATYMEARKNPAIVHYAGPTKPWDDVECDFANVFWRYARKAPLYEVVLHRMQVAVAQQEAQKMRDEVYATLHAELDGRIEDLRREVEGTREWLGIVDEELHRFEDRSIGLMTKELVYRKMFLPVARTVRGDEKDSVIYRAWHRVRPGKDD